MQGASLTTSDAGGGQKDGGAPQSRLIAIGEGVPSGCEPNRRLLRQNSYAYHPGMPPSFFLASIRFV